VDLVFDVGNGHVTLTTAAVRQFVVPHLRHPEARSAIASILERAYETRVWDLDVPGFPEASAELRAQIVRAGGPPRP
jgi:hypothetical protein